MIVGAGNAIGRATALRLARAGMHLVLCDANRAELESLAAELAGVAPSAAIAPVGIGEEAALAQLARETADRHGGVDALVNVVVGTLSAPPCGANGARGALHDGLHGCLASVRATVPCIQSENGGHVVNVVSAAGRYRSAWFRAESERGDHACEAALGGGILALTRELAFELAARRIRVNAVALGWIRGANGDAEWARLSARERAFVLEEISLGRLGEPDEVAAVVEFLATDASSYVTGTTVDVNGGWWMS